MTQHASEILILALFRASQNLILFDIFIIAPKLFNDFALNVLRLSKNYFYIFLKVNAVQEMVYGYRFLDLQKSPFGKA